MVTDDLSFEQKGKFLSTCPFSEWQKIRPLCQTINYYPDTVILDVNDRILRSWEFDNEIHSDGSPRSSWYRQRFEHSVRFMPRCLCLVPCVTIPQPILDSLSQVRPVVGLENSADSPGDSKMSTMFRLVNLFHKFFLFLNRDIGSAIIPRVVVDDLHTLDLAWLPCVTINDSFMKVFVTGAFFPKRRRTFRPWLQRMHKCAILANHKERR